MNGIPLIDEDQDDEICSYLATCPVTSDLARRIAGLLNLPWEDPEVIERAMCGLGWDDDADVPVDEVRLVTDLGHLVHGDFCLYMPFAHLYTVGGDLWPEDGWGTRSSSSAPCPRRRRSPTAPRCPASSPGRPDDNGEGRPPGRVTALEER
ncbi:hypothetical protein [Actinoallomurus soli]|uniref:hypothetical protein n=1 Tax=Actinoallomurus soli TaxID=2952535 RepID=UPI0020938177|nr:hypothetical protein [Actinoallomurus soli]MCO5969546.1 hypothetical protein [Actinoallomurus soli]